ncbi:MAG: alpha-hydroxy acid oxidase [Gemmatimonadota bacterium]
MSELLTLDDYERAAEAKFDPASWAYMAGGGGDEFTLRRNRDAFSRILLAPRVLNDVSKVDTSVRLLGQTLAHPILLAPVAAHSLAHQDGEVETARGALEAGAGMVLSSYTSRRIEHVADVGVKPLWFQLYMQDRAPTEKLIREAVERGCTGLCVTVDTPTTGPRDRQAGAGFEFPPNLPYRTVEPGDNPVTWKDIEWIQRTVDVPVILKGILHPDDAALAVQNGAAAIVVSNHGGRNLDTVPSTIEALPWVVHRVAGRIPVLVDGGIRRGTDVLKCLALGASAVMIGRPYVYGLAVAGAKGVSDVVGVLRRELEQSMALSGVRSISEITDQLIWRAPTV